MSHVLDSIDLFEISLVAAPANADTRILSAKSIGADVRADTQAWMERILADVGPAEDLREKSLRLAKQAAPPKTASFPVE